MNHRSNEALRVLHAWPWKPASEIPNRELSYWLSRAEETVRREPTVSKDLLRAVRTEINTVLFCDSSFIRRFIATAAFLAWVSAPVILIHGREQAFLPENVGVRWMVLIAAAVVLSAAFRSFRTGIENRCAHRAVLGRERLHRWLAMPATPPRASRSAGLENPLPHP